MAVNLLIYVCIVIIVLSFAFAVYEILFVQRRRKRRKLPEKREEDEEKELERIIELLEQSKRLQNKLAERGYTSQTDMQLVRILLGIENLQQTIGDLRTEFRTLFAVLIGAILAFGITLLSIGMALLPK